jgi:hypothetical protein
VRADVAHRVVRRAGLGDDLEALLGVEQEAQPLAHHGVVVGENDLDRVGHGGGA